MRVEESTATATAWSPATPARQPEWRRRRRGGRHAARSCCPPARPVDPGVHRARRVLRLRHAAGPAGAAGRAAGLRRRAADRRARPAPAGCATRSARPCPAVAAPARRARSRPRDVAARSPTPSTRTSTAIRAALARADLVCTTGGTMHGPVDHLHPALEELGAEYVVNTVAVRPGFPMLLARVAGPDGRARFVAGLPGNPQSAIVALVSLVAPLLAGLRGRPGAGVAAGHPGRRRCPAAATTPTSPWSASTRPTGTRTRCAHVGSAMLRGLAQARRVRRDRARAPTGEPGDARAVRTAAAAVRRTAMTRRDRHSVEVTDRAARPGRPRGRGRRPAGRRGRVVPGRRARPRPRARGRPASSTRGTRARPQVLREVAAEIAEDPGGLRGRGLPPGRPAGDRRRGAGRRGQHRAPGGRRSPPARGWSTRSRRGCRSGSARSSPTAPRSGSTAPDVSGAGRRVRCGPARRRTPARRPAARAAPRPARSARSPGSSPRARRPARRRSARRVRQLVLVRPDR